jgi:hypothetical protein
MTIKRSSPPTAPSTLRPPEGERRSTRVRTAKDLNNGGGAREITLERQAFPVGLPRTPEVPAEIDRVRLIAELSRILRDDTVPEHTRRAGLTLVGWLARRMPGEPAHALGCEDPAEVTLVRQRR